MIDAKLSLTPQLIENIIKVLQNYNNTFTQRKINQLTKAQPIITNKHMRLLKLI